MSTPRRLDDVFDTFDATWEPRIVTTVNDYDVRIARCEGDRVFVDVAPSPIGPWSTYHTLRIPTKCADCNTYDQGKRDPV